MNFFGLKALFSVLLPLYEFSLPFFVLQVTLFYIDTVLFGIDLVIVCFGDPILSSGVCFCIFATLESTQLAFKDDNVPRSVTSKRLNGLNYSSLSICI